MAEETEAQDGGQDPHEPKIEETVRKVLGKLIGSGDVEVSDDDEADEPKAKTKARGRRTLRDEEDDIAGAVRREIEALKAKERHDAEHEALRAKKEEDNRPTTPEKRSKASSWLWGGN